MNEHHLSTTEHPTKIKLKNIDINYLKIGNGPKTLLMFTGILGATKDFNSLTDNLDHEKYTMIIWDPPGYGLSRPPARDFSPGYLDRDADIAISLMEALDVHKYSLLGWCAGGCTALVVASKAADRVEKVVVWSCNARVTEEDLVYLESTRDVARWPAWRRQPLFDAYGEQYVWTTWNDWVDSCRRARQQHRGSICVESLPKIVVPALVLHGAMDGFISAEHAVYLHENIPGSALEIFPTGKHHLHLMLMEQFNSTVDKFLTNDH